ILHRLDTHRRVVTVFRTDETVEAGDPFVQRRLICRARHKLRAHRAHAPRPSPPDPQSAANRLAECTVEPVGEVSPRGIVNAAIDGLAGLRVLPDNLLARPAH